MPGIYTDYVSSGQIFNSIIDQDRHYRMTLSEETVSNTLGNLLRGDKRCEFLLKNLLIKLVSEDKKFANLLRKYLFAK